MSWVLPRTENTSSRRGSSPALGVRAAGGIFHRVACAKSSQLFVRLACGLLAAVHVAPLLRVSRNVLEQGPSAVLVATWAVLALLIGVLAAKAAGLAFFPARSRRTAAVTFLLISALFHGDVLASKDVPPTIAVLSTTATAAGVVILGRKLHEHLSGGFSLKSLFPANIWARLAPQPACDPVCLVTIGSRRPRGPPRAATRLG
jgi:hypothetical protein